MGARKIVGLMACDPRGVIGSKEIKPWSYPKDLAHFRRTTYQQVMVMGRTTFDAISLPTLKDRFSIVFSRQYKEPHWIGETIVFVPSLRDFLALTGIPPEKEIYMIGGAQIARLFFEANLVSEMLLTKVHKYHKGDTIFPLAFLKDWVEETIKEEDGFTIYRYTPIQDKKLQETYENQPSENACN